MFKAMAESRGDGRSKPLRKKRVVFSLDAPNARQVHVTGTFCDWQADSCALKRDSRGKWSATLSLPPGRYEYRFLVDGGWRDDPKCTERVLNAFGTENCILHVLREAAHTAHSAIGNESVA
jgi:1,4-alpha-glucan branching enzyme